MSDLTRRKKLLNELGEVWLIPTDEHGRKDKPCETAFAVIKNQPMVDIVEVVRCKDCIYSIDFGEGDINCSHWTNGLYTPTEPDAFCSYGVNRSIEEVTP